MLGGDVLGGLIAGHPNVPKWQPITAESQQAAAIKGNLQSLPELEKLAGQTNTFNQSELERMLSASIPGYKNIMEQGSEVVQSQLGGQLSDSEIRSIERNINASNIGRGTGLTQFSKFDTARELGIGTLERQQSGLNNAQSWIRNSAALTTPQMFNTASMFLSPESTFQMNFQNQTQKFSRDWMNNQLKWGSKFTTLLGKSMADTDASLSGMIGMGAGGAATGGGGGY
jgi:hypothetical protein